VRIKAQEPEIFVDRVAAAAMHVPRAVGCFRGGMGGIEGRCQRSECPNLHTPLHSISASAQYRIALKVGIMMRREYDVSR
jgi:hypothetical protein